MSGCSMVDCSDRVKLLYRAAKLIKSEITDCRGISIRPPIMVWMSSSFVYHRLILSTRVCWSHALVNGPTSKRPASGGGLCSGQLLVMWSAVCSGSPHSHAALSASPHFFMDALYRPTPVRNLFRVVQCFRHRSYPLTSSAGFDTWRCTRVGPDASHSCFHVAAIHASFDRSSGMTLSIS